MTAKHESFVVNYLNKPIFYMQPKRISHGGFASGLPGGIVGNGVEFTKPEHDDL